MSNQVDLLLSRIRIVRLLSFLLAAVVVLVGPVMWCLSEHATLEKEFFPVETLLVCLPIYLGAAIAGKPPYTLWTYHRGNKSEKEELYDRLPLEHKRPIGLSVAYCYYLMFCCSMIGLSLVQYENSMMVIYDHQVDTEYRAIAASIVGMAILLLFLRIITITDKGIAAALAMGVELTEPDRKPSGNNSRQRRRKRREQRN